MSLLASQSDKPALARPVSPVREVWTIAWPTVLTMTSYTMMQFTDKLMVGQVGPLELAAQTNGGIWSFALLSFALGVMTVVNTYVSQNLGAGTPRNGPKYAWASFWLGLGIWLAILVPYGLAMDWVFTGFLPAVFPQQMAGHSPELLKMEIGYGQILVFGSITLLIGRGLNQFFFGMHRPGIVTFAAISGNIVDLILNYVLIFGHKGIPGWGLPGVPGVEPMGVYGAAISTVIGSIVELAIPALVFLGPKLHAELSTRSSWRPQWRPMGQLLRLGWPAAIQWGNELICWAIFTTIFVGAFGSHHMTACSITFGYMHMSFMPAVGFSVATNSLVGKYCGAGRPDLAAARTRLSLVIAMAYMSFCALIFVVFRQPLVGFFLPHDVPDRQAILEIGMKLMICSAIFQTADALGVIYTGALRGAGDTVWPGVMTFIYSWVLLGAGGWLAVELWPQLQSLGPWIAAAIYIIAYGLTMWIRFARGHWRSIKLVDGSAAPAQAGVEGATMPGPQTAEFNVAVRDFAEPIAVAPEHK